jgi:hypothetical protein
MRPTHDSDYLNVQTSPVNDTYTDRKQLICRIRLWKKVFAPKHFCLGLVPPCLIYPGTFLTKKTRSDSDDSLGDSLFNKGRFDVPEVRIFR